MNTRLLEAVRMPARITEPRDELHEAFENYRQLKAENSRLMQENLELRVENGSMVAEVRMLREALDKSDDDCRRLQATSSSLAGGLKAINAVIADQLRTAIKNGIEAVNPDEKEAELEEAGAEVRGIIERVEPAATADILPRAALTTNKL